MYYRSLQVARGLAALSVMLSHMRFNADAIGDNPDSIFRFFDPRFSYGAWFFFVLSGFLMASLIAGGYRRFLLRRLIRIYPPYWLAIGAVLLANYAVLGSPVGRGLLNVLLLAPFDPAATYPLFVEWTLIYEVYFYCLCAVFANDRLRHVFPYFLLVWSAALLAAHAWFGVGAITLPTLRFLPLSLMNLLFAAGGLSFYALRRLPRQARLHYVLGVAASVPFAVAIFARGALLQQVILLSIAFALAIVAFCLWEEGSGGTRRFGVLERFGDHSYALYLLHAALIALLLRALRPYVEGPIGNGPLLLIMGIVLVAGWYGGRLDVALHRRLSQRIAGARRPDAGDNQRGEDRIRAVG